MPEKVCVLEVGASLLGFDAAGRTLKPQQYELAAVLDALNHETAVLMPRRASKTSTILAWMIGMCATVPGIQCAFTMATTGKAARDRFEKELKPPLMHAVESGAPLSLRRADGRERVNFDNGSLLQFLAPSGSEFRSQAFDVVVVDEGGEATPDDGEELMAAILPTLDTSSISMLIIAGTAGEFRTGNLLWDSLERGRNGEAGILEYGAGDEVDMSRLEDWAYVAGLLEQYHPGIGTLTTLAHMERNYKLMKRNLRLFAREYLSVWGHASGDGGLFDANTWASGQLNEALPSPPSRFSLCLHSDSKGRWAIVAAWREDDTARLLLVDRGEAIAGAAPRARELARKYRVPIIVDPRSSQVMADVKQRLEALRPAPRIEVQTYEDVAAAIERITDDVNRGIVQHWGQEAMTTAFLRVKKVQMGARWKFGGITDEDETAPAVAAALALRHFDANPRRVSSVPATVAV